MQHRNCHTGCRTCGVSGRVFIEGPEHVRFPDVGLPKRLGINPTPLEPNARLERGGRRGERFLISRQRCLRPTERLQHRSQVALKFRGTIAARNGQSGLEDRSGSATFTGNRTTFNHLFGILAQASDVDGGGNVAYGNGAGQCVNVSCSP